MPETSPIFLLNGASGQPVTAELIDEVGDVELGHWRNDWLPVLRERFEALTAAGRPLPSNRHWNWSKKIEQVEALLGFESYCVVSDGMTQGLARFDLMKFAREPSQHGKPMVYVDYLETAPWNRRDLGFDPPRYRGVGSALVTAAVQKSIDEGFKGVVGLHSLPEADEFYARMDFINLGADPRVQDLTYFELTPERARAFLE